MKYLPGPHQTVHTNYFKILDFLQKEIEEHQEQWNPDNPRDYIDVYLTEMQKVTHQYTFQNLAKDRLKFKVCLKTIVKHT